MKSGLLTLTALLTSVASCSPEREPQEPAKNASAPVLPAPSAPPAIENDAPAAEAPETPMRTSLPEPKGSIDPKSVEAAGQVVQRYGALIEANRLDDAARLWGNAQAAAAFQNELHPQTHLEIGKLGPAEGAAGSIYTTIPVVFYRDSVRRSADIVLRRVNDVPGSTEAQRRWHIERIDWGGAA